MKSVILGILTFLGTLQAHTKVIAKFGSSQCPWSEQLKQEVWNSSSFQALLKGANIEREESSSHGQDETLPAFVLVTENREEIGRLGYLLISPEKYVDLMKEMLSIHTLCQSVSNLNSQQILHLYRKAQVLHMRNCEDKLLQEGLAKDTGVEFLIEQYAQNAKNHPRKAHKIKQEIRTRKPHDVPTEWEIAMISFQARRERFNHLSKVVLPLEKFLRNYGRDHSEYQWRCHLVLAEFYQDKDQMGRAKFHAIQAAQGAPEELKEMISSVGD